MNSGNRSGQQPQNNVFGFRKTTMMLTLLNVLVAMLILFASTSTDAAACKKADLTPKINPDSCRPQLKMKKPACDKLIAKCRCQHNIMMKWVAGGGCPKNTPAGASGCQCATFCDFKCAGKCNGDKSGNCAWSASDGKCKNRFTGATGGVPQCRAPTATPTKSPSGSPTTSSPSLSPTTSNPSSSPTTSVPSASPSRTPTTSTPSNSPTTSVPSRSPSKTPTTSTPSRSPSKTPTTSVPSRSPSKTPTTSTPSRSPSKTPTTSVPSRSPSKTPTTSTPSRSPSKTPTTSTPSRSPSKTPTTSTPSRSPSKTPTTSVPSRSPSKTPTTSVPSRSPSKTPTTSVPSRSPSKTPTTSVPSRSPSKTPTTSVPSRSPSKTPTTSTPSRSPSKSPITSTPSKSPVTSAPSKSPVTSAPSNSPITKSPTVCYNQNPANRVAGGSAHSCGINNANNAKCWGVETYGRLGNGQSGTVQPSAVTVSSLTNEAKIFTGGEHSCAITNSKAVFCWGRNDDRQLGANGNSDSNVPFPVSLGTGELAENMCLGLDHTCAVTTSGKVLCWGKNDKRQCGQTGNSDINTPTQVGASLNKVFVQVACANQATCALTNEGKVYCWGDNDQGELGRGSADSSSSSTPALASNLDSVTLIAAGAEHFCARVTCEGKLKCWGRNDEGQVGTGSAGSKVTAPVNAVTSNFGVLSFSGSYRVSCMVLTGGAVRCWGAGGRRGDGSFSNSLTPTAVSGISTAVEVSCGLDHCCVLLENQSIRCFGEGDSGQLGDGDSDDSNTPVTVSSFN